MCHCDRIHIQVVTGFYAFSVIIVWDGIKYNRIWDNWTLSLVRTCLHICRRMSSYSWYQCGIFFRSINYIFLHHYWSLLPLSSCTMTRLPIPTNSLIKLRNCNLLYAHSIQCTSLTVTVCLLSEYFQLDSTNDSFKGTLNSVGSWPSLCSCPLLTMSWIDHLPAMRAD